MNKHSHHKWIVILLLAGLALLVAACAMGQAAPDIEEIEENLA